MTEQIKLLILHKFEGTMNIVHYQNKTYIYILDSVLIFVKEKYDWFNNFELSVGKDVKVAVMRTEILLSDATKLRLGEAEVRNKPQIHGKSIFLSVLIYRIWTTALQKFQVQKVYFGWLRYLVDLNHKILNTLKFG
jgi:hypothetical protein